MGKKRPAGPSRHSRGVKANEVTEIFVESLQERENDLRSRHTWLLPTLNQMSTGSPITFDMQPPAGMAPQDQAMLVDIAAHVGVYRLWARQGRVTYDVNENLAAELYRSEYEKLPGNIFAHLPHINPLVVLPDPWPVSLHGSEGLVRGFFIHGYNYRPEQQTFTNEEVQGLGLLLVIDLINVDTGEVRGQTHMRLHVPTLLREFTFKQAVTFAAEHLESNFVPATKNQSEEVVSLVESVLKPSLAILIYLCCDNRDAVEPAPFQNTKVRRASVRSDRDPFWVEVGWRMGPKLHAARRDAGRILDGTSMPTGVKRAAHQRAGHFHKFLVGPGRPNQRTQTITRWVEPTWVGVGELPEGADPITTVVTVDPQKHDPLRRRGLRR